MNGKIDKYATQLTSNGNCKEKVTLTLSELQVFRARVDHGVAGDLEQRGSLVQDLHLGLDVGHVGRLLVAALLRGGGGGGRGRGRLELRDRPLEGVAVLHYQVIAGPEILQLGRHGPGDIIC